MNSLASLRKVGFITGSMSLCLLVAGCGGGVPNVVSGGATLPAPAAVSTGPQLGYMWNPADQTLRPILGVPGASQVGQAVTPAGLYVAGAGSAHSSIAVLQAADGSLNTMQLPSGATSLIAGASAPSGSQIVFSPSGLNALVFQPGGASLTLFTGLSSAPQVQNLTAPASLLGAAVSDSAQVAVVAGSGPLVLSLLTGSKSPLASLSGFGGLNFLAGGDDLLFADASTGAVTLLRNSSTAPAPQNFSSSTIVSPLAVAASQDGHWAVVANGGDASVVRLDLSGGSAPLRIACTCQPSQLASVSGNAVFRLTAPGTGPAWLVDASSATPKTLFIPAMVAALPALVPARVPTPAPAAGPAVQP